MVPFAAGGNSDVIARILAQRLSEVFGQQFVIENRPGASGTLAAEAVARAPADGHTLFMGSPSQITIAPTLTKTSYDPVKDFAPISLVGSNPFVLTAHPSVPAKTLTEFLAYARSHPEQIPYAHAGNGTIVHLAMVVFQRRAGIEMMPVVYKGGASQVLNDVVGGHMATYLSPLPPAVPLGNTGALRLLGVTSAERMPQIPEVPTFAESGFPGYKILTWSGLMAPAGTPQADHRSHRPRGGGSHQGPGRGAAPDRQRRGPAGQHAGGVLRPDLSRTGDVGRGRPDGGSANSNS